MAKGPSLTLDSFIGSLAAAALQAQSISDATTAKVSEHYATRSEFARFPVPRLSLTEVEFSCELWILDPPGSSDLPNRAVDDPVQWFQVRLRHLLRRRLREFAADDWQAELEPAFEGVWREVQPQFLRTLENRQQADDLGSALREAFERHLGDSLPESLVEELDQLSQGVAQLIPGRGRSTQPTSFQDEVVPLSISLDPNAAAAGAATRVTVTFSATHGGLAPKVKTGATMESEPS